MAAEVTARQRGPPAGFKPQLDGSIVGQFVRAASDMIRLGVGGKLNGVDMRPALQHGLRDAVHAVHDVARGRQDDRMREIGSLDEGHVLNELGPGWPLGVPGPQTFEFPDATQGNAPYGQGAREAHQPIDVPGEQTALLGLVRELQAIDRRVREHEAAHLRAGRGVVTSGANFNYVYGPDGRQYAVSGEVGIDTSPERKPEANIDKGERIQAAALAPRDPSEQDYRVAAVGAQLESRGRADLAVQQAEQRAVEAEQGRAERERLREEASSAVRAAAVRAYASPVTVSNSFSVFA